MKGWMKLVSSLIILLYSMVCIIGVIALIIRNLKQGIVLSFSKKISLTFFAISHFLFLALGIATLFNALPFIWLVATGCLIIGSRILNGLTLYGKNNWRHYIVTGALLFSIISLYLMGI